MPSSSLPPNNLSFLLFPFFQFFYLFIFSFFFILSLFHFLKICFSNCSFFAFSHFFIFFIFFHPFSLSRLYPPQTQRVSGFGSAPWSAARPQDPPQNMPLSSTSKTQPCLSLHFWFLLGCQCCDFTSSESSRRRLREEAAYCSVATEPSGRLRYLSVLVGIVCCASAVDCCMAGLLEGVYPLMLACPPMRAVLRDHHMGERRVDSSVGRLPCGRPVNCREWTLLHHSSSCAFSMLLLGRR